MKKCTVPLITKVTNLKHASYSRLMLLEIKIPLFFFPIAAKKDKKLFSLHMCWTNNYMYRKRHKVFGDVRYFVVGVTPIL